MDPPKTPETDHENAEYDTEDARNPMTEGDLHPQLQIPDASTHNTEDDYSFLEDFNLEEYTSADTPETSEENRKKEISNEEDTRNAPDAYRQSRPEVFGTKDQVAFDFSGNVYNPDYPTREMTMSSQIALDSESQACQEFLNFEESIRKRQELKASDYLGKEENSSIGQRTAYNKNILQMEGATSEMKNIDISKATNVCSVDDWLAVPGTSHSLEDDSYLKLIVENLQIVSPLKQQPQVETEQKTTRDTSAQTEESIFQEPTGDASTQTPEEGLGLHEQPPASSENSKESKKRKISNGHSSNVSKIQKKEKQRKCSICKMTRIGHLDVDDGKIVYKCCWCQFINAKFNNLQMHIYDEHCKPFYCNVCQMKYSKEGSHGEGGTCDLCFQNFRCKFELEEHHTYFPRSSMNYNA